MKKDEKKYRRSPVSAACYVIAALLFVYACYQIGTTVQTINEYYGSYGMNAQPLEYVTYSLQSALQPIVYVIVVFMLGYILDAVRRNNKAYYLSDEDLREAEEARKQAREAKKLAKGEAAALKAGNVTAMESSVEADFAKSLDEELKADGKKAAAKSENRKPRSYNYSKSGQNRQGGNKSVSKGGNKGGSDINKSAGESSNSAGSGKSTSEGGKSAGESNKSGGSRKAGGSIKRGSGQHKSSKKPADKPKLEDATKTKAADGFDVVIKDSEN